METKLHEILASCAELLNGEALILNKLYENMPYETYAAICKQTNAVRASSLKLIKKSPRKLKWSMDNPSPETDALRIGKNVHTLFEKPEEFRARLVHMPEFTGFTLDGKLSKNSKDAKQQKAFFLSQLPPDAIVAEPEEIALYWSVINLLGERKLATSLLKNAVKEVSLFVWDPDTGMVLACRPDFITQRGDCCDIKTTRDGSLSFFWKEIFAEWAQFYVLGAAHYSHCLKLAKVGDGKRFTYLAVEKEPPVDISVYVLDEGHLDFGDHHRRHLTALYAECLKTNTWPGYPDRAQSGDLPAYASYPSHWDDEK